MAQNNRTYIAATLLAMLLTACHGEEEAPQPLPTNQQLSAQIWVSLERAAATGTTRQGTTVVQQDGTFRGLESVLLIPYRLESVPATGEAVAATDTRLDDNCALGAIAPGELFANSNSHLYDDVQLTVGTNAFLLYAEATVHTDEEGVSSPAVNGAITESGLNSDTPAGISFSPVSICTAADLTAAQTTAEAMANYLTSLLNTGIVIGTEPETSSLKWSDVTSGVLEGLYNELKGFTTGNSRNLQAMLQNIYDRLQAASLIGDQAALRTAILAKIPTDGEGKVDLSATTSTTTFASYPSSLGLPDGAVKLIWDDTDADESKHKFVSVTDGTPNNVGSTTLPLGSFVHPLPLYYRANTAIKVSNSIQGDKYEAKDSWADIIKDLYTDGTAVSPATHSVALEQPAQYAVGRLDVLLKASAATIADFYGNAVDMSKVQLTGIIVTGQRRVDYCFCPLPDPEAPAAPEPLYAVYDRDMPATLTLDKNIGKTTAPTDNATLTHTLVLQTPVGEAEPIYFEFLNNTGQDIAVHNGLVPTGCHFYLCGIVTPAAGGRVFEQDHVATITGTVSSLSGAYNSLPPRQHAFGFDMQVAVREWNDRGEETHPVYNW